jgi:hypothetical protein
MFRLFCCREMIGVSLFMGTFRILTILTGQVGLSSDFDCALA